MKVPSYVFAGGILLGCGGSIATGTTLSPIVELPGTGGTQLEAKLDKTSSPHWWCAKSADWFTLWLDATQLLPGAVECWCDNIQLIYDEEQVLLGGGGRGGLGKDPKRLPMTPTTCAHTRVIQTKL